MSWWHGINDFDDFMLVSIAGSPIVLLLIGLIVDYINKWGLWYREPQSPPTEQEIALGLIAVKHCIRLIKNQKAVDVALNLSPTCSRCGGRGHYRRGLQKRPCPWCMGTGRHPAVIDS